jgi:serine phosphatase RsbU (regulator of sigma subunit)
MIHPGRIFSLFFLMIISLPVRAQIGTPILTDYNPCKSIEDQSYAICQDSYNVMMFAYRRGILTFDGKDWNQIQLPVIPSFIKFNPGDKKVYVGSDNNYGFLERDELGIYKYFSLNLDSAPVGLVSQILFTDSTVYFYAEHTISRHSLFSGNLQKRFVSKGNDLFTGMVVTPKNTFINVANKGLFRIESDTLFPIVTGYQLQNEEILFCLPYDNNMVLLGLGNSTLKLFDGIKFYDYQIKDDGYLQQNSLSKGIVVSDSLYAFSTLDGGAMVINKTGGTVRYTINSQIGLKDEEVFALGVDMNYGLWLSHQYGLTRADLHLPVGNFSTYPGLKGNPITSLWYKNKLYVATSEGIFYLDEKPEYVNIEVFVKNVGVAIKEYISNAPQINTQQIKVPQKTRKNIFSRIFGKKTHEPEVSDTTVKKPINPLAPENIAVKRLPQPEYIRKTVRKVKSMGYVYLKISGLNEKCKQLLATDNGILAATNKGLFNIVDPESAATTIVKDRYINFISEKSVDNKYYIGANDGYFSVAFESGKWAIAYPDRGFALPVYSVVSSDENTLWLGGDDMIYEVLLNRGVASGYKKTYSVKSDFPQRYIVEFVNDTIFLFAESGIYYLDRIKDSLKEYKPGLISNSTANGYIFSQVNAPWIFEGENWIYIRSDDKVESNDRSILKIFDDIISVNTDNNSIWVINGNGEDIAQLFRIQRGRLRIIKPDINLFIKSIKNQEGLNFRLTNIKFERGDNMVKFEIVAPSYIKNNSIQYQHVIDKGKSQWSEWSTDTKINLVVEPGKHTLQVRARDLWGNVSNPPIKIDFSIDASFTQTTFFFIIISIAGLWIIIMIIRFRERKLKKDKSILEAKVKERTAEIEAQKEEITSSIAYASRIQRAMLPVDDHFKDGFSDHFVLFRPRDIVSGDFYWIGEDENHFFFTVADCTGHGVPGAFMSTLGISALNEIITNKKNLHANTVLNLLREKIKTSLHQTGKEGEAADGMDVAFCMLHKNRKILEYSGAYNPLLIFQRGELKEYKADRMPIGIYYREKGSFTNYEINVNKGDTIYIFSDGFTDQFGGIHGGTFRKSNFKKLLSEIYYRPMSEQLKILENELENWRGRSDQVDDITVMGIRI